MLLFLAFVKLIRLSIYVFMGAIIIQAVLSWVAQNHPMAPFFRALTRPFLQPFQRAIPPIGGVDITPLLVLIAFQLVLMLPVGWLEAVDGGDAQAGLFLALRPPISAVRRFPLAAVGPPS